ncbi:MAG TPA: hypothetical protein VK968_09915 [Roseimicrobium sp.]|nr:hypothetical protein [Roseimicrobium sp.]
MTAAEFGSRNLDGSSLIGYLKISAISHFAEAGVLPVMTLPALMTVIDGDNGGGYLGRAWVNFDVTVERHVDFVVARVRRDGLCLR